MASACWWRRRRSRSPCGTASSRRRQRSTPTSAGESTPARRASGNERARVVTRLLHWGLIALLALLAALLALQFWYLAHLIHWREANPTSTAFIRAQLAAFTAAGARIRIDQ